MVIIRATELTSPSKTKTRAMPNDTIDALAGSRESPFPLVRKTFSFRNGNILSDAIACKVRGATIIEPMAEEEVQAASPNGTTNQPNKAILDMINWSAAKSSCEAETANFQAINI